MLLAAPLALAALFLANLAYQVGRKPSEILAPFGRPRTPAETWQAYGRAFRAHATEIMTPPFLAALAHAESGGDPVAAPTWRWAWSLNPFEIFAPASSAVGLYQITDGNFREARRYCIRNHRVAREGPWWDWRSCWFTWLYTRTLAGHAVEMTSAYLHQAVEAALRRRARPRATLEQQQDLAAIIHLCGPRRGDAFVARGFRLASRERCGSHPVRPYVERVRALRAVFVRLADAGAGSGGGARPTRAPR